MTPELHVVLDDREAPPESVTAALGSVRFGEIVHSRRRVSDALSSAAASANSVIWVREDEEAEGLARRIEEAEYNALWLRLPLAIPPLDSRVLEPLIAKARYARRTMFIGRLFGDDAPMVLTGKDAVTLLRAKDAEARRAWLIKRVERTPVIEDIGAFVDLRKPQAVMRFLAGATETRHFSSIEAEGGIFRKRSADRRKMQAEHDFFHLAPAETKRFLVPTFGFEDDGQQAGYAMEHLEVPDAALQFVHGAFSKYEFAELLDRLFAFLAGREPGPADRRAMLATAREQIVDKLVRRLDELLATEVGRRLDRLLTAIGPMGGIATMRDRALPLIEAALERDPSERLVFSHGDPCLSNILYDRRLGLMRLIDPRGALERDDAMMHPLYDIAKVSHSIVGGYDFVNNELFSVQVDESLGLRLCFERGGPPPWARAVFESRLSTMGEDPGAVRAVEMSLFLSMLPLHRDHPVKLAGFALIAAGIIEELEAT